MHRVEAFFRSIWRWFKKWDLLPGKSMSLRRAEEMARVLLSYDVDQVLLFGSVARRGVGNDIDLIAIVEYMKAWDFIVLSERWRGWSERRRIYHCSASRLWAAEELLNHAEIDWVKLEGDKWGEPFPYTPDVFLMPDDWRTNSVFEMAMENEDPNFFANIERDVKVYDQARSCFTGINWWSNYFTKYGFALAKGGRLIKYRIKYHRRIFPLYERWLSFYYKLRPYRPKPIAS